MYRIFGLMQLKNVMYTCMQKVVGSSPVPAHSPIFSVGVFVVRESIYAKFSCNTLD